MGYNRVMIKLIASDLDGTLLNRFHVTDWFILNTIDKVIEKDIHFVIATGRSMQKNQFSEIFGKRKLYRIINNGSIIVSPYNEVIYEQLIDKQFIEDTLNRFPDQPFDFVSFETTYINTSKKRYLKEFEAERQYVNRKLLKSLAKFFVGNKYDVPKEEILTKNIVKINCRFTDIKVLQEFKEHLSQYPNIVNNPFSDVMFELTHHTANKANALKFLLEKLNIDKEHVVVFGDGNNDIQLLSEFKNSYAPKNATQEAKIAATHMIGYNKYYSVPRKIRQLIRKVGK